MKVCPNCKQNKPETDYYTQGKNQRPVTYCKICHNAKNAEWKKHNKDKINGYPSKQNQAKYQKKYRQDIKDEVFERYGGYRCICCDEREKMFLSIDHINNDGAKERKLVKTRDFYNYLRKKNYPDGYQVLCMNCNWGKFRNKGICPHMENLQRPSKAFTSE